MILENSKLPLQRVRGLGDAAVRPSGRYVLYWMTAYRRTRWSFALQRAAEWSRELRRPLLVLEALRCDYRWASDRLHRFVVEGMRDNAARLEGKAVYYPYLEPSPGAGKGLLAALAGEACVVVTDAFPSFFLPRMLRAAVPQVPVRFEEVDSNGLLPVRTAGRSFPTAYAFRRFLQRELPGHLADAPAADPLRGMKLPRKPSLPARVRRQWPAVSAGVLAGEPAALERTLASLPIDHAVGDAGTPGGAVAAAQRVERFVRERLTRYDDDRNQPEQSATSELSPYLHFGHLSAHEVFDRIARHEDWDPGRLSASASGKRSGWWGMSPAAEAFLDQLVTWRELGYNGCEYLPDYDRYESLPPWALRTLREHRGDRREHLYSLAEFEAARTHDPLWNAAQAQLVREGTIHNYLRMLWGKKILEWTPSGKDALGVMIELNNKYALDGRNPNSYSGIFWVLGRYDRPWGPERPVFGKVRYMTSANTARKVRVRDYLRRYDPAASPSLF